MSNLTQDFQSNTQFINDEFQKLRMVYGTQQIPSGMLKKISSSIWSQYRTISVLDKKKTKFRIKIEWAIFTMPHNWLWKVFHSKLWAKVKEELKSREEEKEKEQENIQEIPEVPYLQPAVPVDLQALSYPNSMIKNNINE